MRLADYARNWFPDGVRARGMDCLRSVCIEELSQYHVVAHVHGQSHSFYDVTAEVDGGMMNVACSCPYFGSSGPCKHLYAVLVTAGMRGGLASADVVKRLALDSGSPARAEFAWRAALNGIVVGASQPTASRAVSRESQIVYLLDPERTLATGHIGIELAVRSKKRDGSWSRPERRLDATALRALADPTDREILAVLSEPRTEYEIERLSSYALRETLAAKLLPAMCGTGRCMLRIAGAVNTDTPLHWDDGVAWQLRLKVERQRQEYVVTGELVRGDACTPLSEPLVLTASGLVIWRHAVSRFESAAFQWVVILRSAGELRIPISGATELLRALHAYSPRPHLDLSKAEDLDVVELRATPKPHLAIRKPRYRYRDNDVRLWAELRFDYDGSLVAPHHPEAVLLQIEQRRLIVRERALERAAVELLQQLGFRQKRRHTEPQPGFELTPKRLPGVVRTLVEAGWHVEAEGTLFRRAHKLDIQVRTGIDWFDLQGSATFGDLSVGLPALLAALKRGETLITLGDGTTGLLPEEWLERYASMAGLGEAKGDRLRFGKNQVGVLDALLATLPEANVDDAFALARERLASFVGVPAVDPPRTFRGELRHYQREGLGWLAFLRDMGFGGCLADDMGLGKTVQALALLESRRAGLPSLAIVPRSLLFNWRAEAARFTPKLRVLDHIGPQRSKKAAAFSGYDLVLTTYGTLRRDAVLLSTVAFDCVILDEAQAIKNAGTEAAKAARVLRAQQRLALTGTPVENHLGELWSLMDFLNPGMLGSRSFARALEADARNPSHEARTFLSRALRPFILRRTKQQVAADLPPKIEETLYCELGSAQRELYDGLRNHYRASLFERIAEFGMQSSKMHVLEALLRLRQAACHPALIDRSRNKESSAKLEALLPMLEEVIDGGHKIVVFSQFVSFLKLVRTRLNAAKLEHEYLDGRTRDRASKVRRFQDDPACKLFLVSLKAGGLGLNLTAADYVFLLDPWWNPAVEAQALDRAHRIGQTRRVFAYRLVARDTIEEKILALQAQKKGLADDIINADNALLRKLGRKELELLLA